MFDRDKPLFSRPVLAVIIVASTLAIWLLNLTAPKANLATPLVDSWKTASAIPVTWLNQDSWQGSDKLTISMVFSAAAHDPILTDTTLGMLMGPSLPLSTATINQRLTLLAARVESFHAPQRQVLSLTLSSQPQYLQATLALVTTWLNNTQFKATALQRWQYQQHTDQALQQLQLQLLNQVDTPFSAPSRDITLADLNQHLDHLKQHLTQIVITGDLTANALASTQQGLDLLTQTMQHHDLDHPWRLASAPAVSSLGHGELNAIYGAVGLQPLSSVTDWLTLQIWAHDMLQWQKSTFNSQVGQWQLFLVSSTPYAQWQIQIPKSVHQDPGQQAIPDSWLPFQSLPSYQDPTHFKTLKQTLLTQLERLSQNPGWWAQVGSRIARPGSSLTLSDFARDYSEAANSFTIKAYREHLSALVIPSSRQEVQFKP